MRQRTIVRILICLGIVGILLVGARAIDTAGNVVKTIQDRGDYDEVTRMLRNE